MTYTGPVNSDTKKITVPKTVKYGGVSYKVTRIADNALRDNKNVTYVSIGSNVKTIGSRAFYGCSSLKTLVIGSKVKTIGKKAFYNCKALEKVTFKGSKVRKVGEKAMKGIGSGAVIKIPDKLLMLYPKFEKNLRKGKKIKI